MNARSVTIQHENSNKKTESEPHHTTHDTPYNSSVCVVGRGPDLNESGECVMYCARAQQKTQYRIQGILKGRAGYREGGVKRSAGVSDS